MRKSRPVAFALALTFVALGFYMPLVGILSFSTLKLGSFDPKLLQILWFTVWQAAASTALTVVIGLPLAYLLYRKRFAGQRFFRALLTVPFILPILVIAIAFSTFQKSNVSISPILLIIAAHIFVNLALVVRTVGSAWQALSSSQDEATELDGAGRFRTFWSVSLPSLRPSLVASATLVYAYTSASFAIVLVLGSGMVQSIETAIYQAALVYLDLDKAALLALCQLALMVTTFWLSEVFARNAALDFTDGDVADARTRAKLDRRDWPVVLYGLLVGALFVLPIWNVFLKAFTFGDTFSFTNFTNLFGDADNRALDVSIAQATLNSLRNISIATVSSVALGLAVAWLLAHSRRTFFSRLVDFAYLAPLGISTVLLGLGYLVTYSTEPFALRSTWLVVPLVETLLALPLVIRMCQSALTSLDHELLSAAQVDGATPWQLFWQIELPLIRPTLEVATGFSAIIALGDFGASSFLAFGDQETVPLVLYRLFSHPGANNYGMAMAVCALLIDLTLAVLVGLSLRSKARANNS